MIKSTGTQVAKTGGAIRAYMSLSGLTNSAEITGWDLVYAKLTEVVSDYLKSQTVRRDLDYMRFKHRKEAFKMIFFL